MKDLRHGYMFSQRNGFGSIANIPTDLFDIAEDIHITKARELHFLLDSFTTVEKAAIRQITPLISILHCSQGNIGSKGNISCVFQQSRLAVILPNLPMECKYIILARSVNANNANLGVWSTKFRKDRIHWALMHLKETRHEAWSNIRISDTNLLSWPEEGDMVDLNPNLIFVDSNSEPNTNASTMPNAGSTNNNDNTIDNYTNITDTLPTNNLNLMGDGGDFEPSPLQNSVIPEEVVEEVVNMTDSSTSAGANADVIFHVIQKLIGSICNGNRTVKTAKSKTANALPNHQFNSDQTEVTFQQNSVLSTNGFANMNTTSFAWARAFPTLFIPTCIKIPDHWEWRIFHDPTGWGTPRDNTVKTKLWYEYMMWRSDGRPAAHPTFDLILYNHNIKNQLQQQGHTF
jgi:hypothetical protein